MANLLPQRMNFIWSRDPQEAYENPYEYQAQEQFLREVKELLNQCFLILMKNNRSYERDDTSVSKAVWMLHVDACDTLMDAVGLIDQKNHRPAGKLFRDVIETIDCATFFCSSHPKREKVLLEWYSNISPKHNDIRNWLSPPKSEHHVKIREEYIELSKFSHRTYRILAYNYILGSENYLSYENEERDSFSWLPHPVAYCCSLLSYYTKAFANSMVFCSLSSEEEMLRIWNEAIEEKPVERHYTTPQQTLQAYLDNKDK